ncbi:MAG: 50S ribosomal protein L11 methyltransferase [Acidobacteria bacterium]|nr:50S ribosomal protein L11 methyltransferase [Acidobacteriota bacterium]
MRTWPALTLTFPNDQPGCDRPGVNVVGETSEPAVSLQDRVSACLDGLDVVAIEEPSADVWRVCFRDTVARDQAVGALGDLIDAGLAIEEVDVPDEDWARRSQAAIHAIRVGGVVVAPPWDPAAVAPTPDALTIVIEPGMGFGSGHHSTTRLCLQALQRVSPHGRAVLDIGTGSGVLAIASALLGASSVLAVDVDPDALDSARTNAALNGDPTTLTFRQADFRAERLPQADIVLANLTGAMLASSADDVLTLCRPGGAAILSGITVEEATGVLEAFASRARIEWQASEEGWIGLIVRP